ncbi:hypothetical protein PV327_007463 [Microctonus hyperodae]|uniref:Uncharacterized protein n=1 Tax=Microctonus hyperodae TaxID=165561 RepID=A0AA39KYN2_MICHY|nr:hypothetical protein PV327_007463 [Microctonus hyperodae]
MTAKASCNRVNPTLTFAMRHQPQLNEIFYSGSLSDVIKVEPKKKVSQSETKTVQSKLNLDSSKSLINVKWAMSSSTRYNIGCILVHSTKINQYHYTYVCIKVVVWADFWINELNFVE